MIARLWWKETRVLWPAWPTLIGAGAALQWLLLALGTDGIRSGLLIPIGLCWATLYALVAASTAFAGERESGTLGLLDALPVRRGTLWLGKATFALSTTLGLALVMLALGRLGSTDLNALPPAPQFVGQFGTLLFETVAWGLLWSALVRNPMIAATLALCSVALVSYGARGDYSQFVSDQVVTIRLLMGAFALAASAVAVVWRPPTGWSSLWFRHSAAETSAERARPIRPRPASAARALNWKAVREGVMLWFGASVVMWAASAWLSLAPIAGTVVFPAALLAGGAALVAGVGVFSGETATGSQRLLLHLGVGPATVWSRTLAPWGIRLAVTTLGMLAVSAVCRPGWWNGFGKPLPGFSPSLFPLLSLLPFVAVVASPFAVGVLSGMVFRRRITAWMIALVAGLAIVPLQVGLAAQGMMPPWALWLTPVALLAVSRVWVGDWLDPRPGSARWLRLGGALAVPSILLPAAYIAHRAWEFPDTGTVASAVPAPAVIAPPLPGSDVAALYRRIVTELFSTNPLVRRGAGVVGDLDFHVLGFDQEKVQEFVDRIGRVAALPPPRLAAPYLVWAEGFEPQPRSTDFLATHPRRRRRPADGLEAQPMITDVNLIAELLNRHGRSRLEEADLAGAWRDVMIQYRMAGQLTGVDPNVFVTQYALAIEERATTLALEWAVDPRQTPERLRQALADLQSLTPFPSIREVTLAAASQMERTLDLSAAELQELNDGLRMRSNPIAAAVHALVYYSWWERERARRLCRMEFKRRIAATVRPTGPPDFDSISYSQRAHILTTSPLAVTLLSPWWLAESLVHATAKRRGLVQVIALRAWSLTHEGTYPETLDALVPDFLDRLPLDPYTGGPFYYGRSTGRPGMQDVQVMEFPRQALLGEAHMIRPGQWLLISAGRDGRLGGGLQTEPQYSGDLVFPLP